MKKQRIGVKNNNNNNLAENIHFQSLDFEYLNEVDRIFQLKYDDNGGGQRFQYPNVSPGYNEDSLDHLVNKP